MSNEHLYEIPICPTTIIPHPDVAPWSQWQRKEQGSRHNKGKAELSMVMEAGRALQGAAQVLTFGKEKYSRGNWKKGLPLTSTVDSLLRHLTALMSNEGIDSETHLAHVDHILCNALFLSEMYHTRPDMDDRIK